MDGWGVAGLVRGWEVGVREKEVGGLGLMDWRVPEIEGL